MLTSISKEFGRLFAERRKALNLSLEFVAERLGAVSIDKVARYENGEEPIPLDDIFALANFLNLPAEEVIALFLVAASSVAPRDKRVTA